jgi:hypothetical protein
MKTRLTLAALATAAVLCLAPRAQATCVIAPDGKSIDVVTDNGADEEKTCAVSCQVDTKVGVVTVGCGGNTPPHAKAHSLCDFDKPEPWYKKVVSSADSCKGAAASAAPVVAAAAPTVKPGTFICRISADGHSFDAMIANPYDVEASCQVNCRISTTLAGSTEQSSCSKNVAPGVGAVLLCSHSFDKGRLVKVIGGSGSCQDPTPKPAAADKDDDDVDVDKLVNAPMPKPLAGSKESDEDMEKLMNDPAKMQEYIRKQMNKR